MLDAEHPYQSPALKIKTGNGGALGTGTGTPAVGAGGDGIRVTASDIIQVNNCSISNTGFDGTGVASASGGMAINDSTLTGTKLYFGNYALNIGNSVNKYRLPVGSAFDPTNGTAFPGGWN